VGGSKTLVLGGRALAESWAEAEYPNKIPCFLKGPNQPWVEKEDNPRRKTYIKIEGPTLGGGSRRREL